MQKANSIFLTIARIIVGVLFIFSGLIKANDPLGLSYKMQEFFEVWGWHGLNNYTLTVAVAMIAFEIIAGVAVLLGWQMRLFSWLLLLLILFFTFLTGYALFSGKIRECGCFGDCIPLQAHHSFIKDIVLLALILPIFLFRNRIFPLFKPGPSVILLFFAAVFSLALQGHTLWHLPLVDCLPYRVGNDLFEQMRPPAGAIPDSTVIVFTYEKDGRRLSFAAEDFPEDFDDSYVFIGREDRIVRKGNAVPAIRDFSLQSLSGTDTTESVLRAPGRKLMLFIREGYQTGDWVDMLGLINREAAYKNYGLFLVTNLDPQGSQGPAALAGDMIPLRADGTAIKTAARYNPTLMLLDGARVLAKWSAPDFDRALRRVKEFSE